MCCNLVLLSFLCLLRFLGCCCWRRDITVEGEDYCGHLRWWLSLVSFTLLSVAEDEDLLLLQCRSIARELGRYRQLVAVVVIDRFVVKALRLVLLLEGAIQWWLKLNRWR
jgi:hypothetical protein